MGNYEDDFIEIRMFSVQDFGLVRSHCLFVLAETEGVGHEVIPAPVSRVFPYNRQSTIELIKLSR